MAETSREKRRQQWRQRIAEQERSGLSARRFCKEQGLGEHSFYWWRKRLGKQEPVRFALVDRGPGRQAASLELVLSGGELLRISAGVDAVTLRTVLETLRA
jgi:transposase